MNSHPVTSKNISTSRFLPYIDPEFRRSFNYLFLGNIIAKTGTGILFTYSFLYLYRIGATLLDLSLIATLPQVAMVLAAVPWGWFSDKTHSRKFPILLASLSQVALFAGLVVLSAPWQFLVLMVITNIIFSPSIPVMTSYITEISPNRGQVISIMSAGNSFGFFLGSTVFGFLFQLTQNFTALWVMGLLIHIIASVLFFFIRQPQLKPQPKISPLTVSRSETRHESLDLLAIPADHGYSHLLRKPLILLATFAMLASTTAFAVYSTYFGPYFIDGLGGPEWLYGVAQGIPPLLGCGLVIFLGSKIDKTGNAAEIAILVSFILQLIAFAGFLTTRDPLLIMVFRSLPESAGLYVGVPAVISKLTSVQNRARGMTISMNGSNLGHILGPFLAGILVTWTTVLSGRALLLMELMPILFLVGLGFSVLGCFFSLVILGKRKRPLSDGEDAITEESIL